MSDVQPNPPQPPTPPQKKPKYTTVAVQVVSLPAELAMAALGGIISGLGAFVGTVTQTNASDAKGLQSAAVAAGFVALTFFTNSLRNWYAQRYAQPVV